VRVLASPEDGEPIPRTSPLGIPHFFVLFLSHCVFPNEERRERRYVNTKLGKVK